MVIILDGERLAKFNELEKELKQFHIDEIGKSYIPIAKFKEFYEDLQDFCFGEIELKKAIVEVCIITTKLISIRLMRNLRNLRRVF